VIALVGGGWVEVCDFACSIQPVLLSSGGPVLIYECPDLLATVTRHRKSSEDSFYAMDMVAQRLVGRTTV